MQLRILHKIGALTASVKRRLPLLMDAVHLAGKVDVVDRAAALALFCMFAAVPTLFVAFAVIGFLLGHVEQAGQPNGDGDVQVQNQAITRLQSWVHDALPGVTWNPAEFAETLVKHKAAHGVFGTVLALSLALTVLSRIDHAIRAFFGLPERSTLKAAGFLTLIILIAGFAAALVTVFAPALKWGAEIAGRSVTVLSLGRLDGLALLVGASEALPVALGFFALVRWSAGNDVSKRRVLIAAATFGVLWFLGQRLFSIYVEEVAKMDAVYGTLTGIVALMMWLFYANLAFLMAVALLAASHNRARTRLAARQVAQ